MDDRKWLYENYEQFCVNSGFKYQPSIISAHRDKLDELKAICKDDDLPFCKVAAIALATWYTNEHLMNSELEFEYECVHLYHKHPEWFEGCQLEGENHE